MFRQSEVLILLLPGLRGIVHCLVLQVSELGEHQWLLASFSSLSERLNGLSRGSQ